MANGNPSQSRRIRDRAKQIIEYIERLKEEGRFQERCTSEDTLNILGIHSYLQPQDCSFLIKDENKLMDKIQELLEEKGYIVSFPDRGLHLATNSYIPPSKFIMTIKDRNEYEQNPNT